MPNYHSHSLQLNAKEEAQFQEVKKRTGHGIKAIFMNMIKLILESQTATEKSTNNQTEEEM